jgi:hypothetical protein
MLMTTAGEVTAFLFRCGLHVFSSFIRTLTEEVDVGVKDASANLPGQDTWIDRAQSNKEVTEVGWQL